MNKTENQSYLHFFRTVILSSFISKFKIGGGLISIASTSKNKLIGTLGQIFKPALEAKIELDFRGKSILVVVPILNLNYWQIQSNSVEHNKNMNNSSS